MSGSQNTRRDMDALGNYNNIQTDQVTESTRFLCRRIQEDRWVHTKRILYTVVTMSMHIKYEINYDFHLGSKTLLINVFGTYIIFNQKRCKDVSRDAHF